jgi:hypothetical protein
MKASSTIGGLAGAVALTLLNETVKKFSPNAPRLDLLGENAVAKLMKGNSFIPQVVQQYFPLAGDLVSNSLFYGMARGKNSSNTLVRGALLGLAAGVGAVVLPKEIGLPERHTNKTTETKLMTLGWYVVGGLVAALVINALDSGPKIPENSELKEGAANAGKKIVKEVAQMV